MPISTYVFDAYGTLFDVNAAVMRHRHELGPEAQRFADLWRSKQLEYSWVRTLMGRDADFWTLTAEALDFAAAAHGGIAPELRRTLLDAYAVLDAYPDARRTLETLRGHGAVTAILSNGSPAMLSSAVAAAGLGEHLDAVLSVAAVGAFKTDPRAYGLVGTRFGIPPGDVAFVSSNRWDVAGATAFGFRSFWINRVGVPDEYRDLPPISTLTSLDDLVRAGPATRASGPATRASGPATRASGPATRASGPATRASGPEAG